MELPHLILIWLPLNLLYQLPQWFQWPLPDQAYLPHHHQSIPCTMLLRLAPLPLQYIIIQLQFTSLPQSMSLPLWFP